MVAVTPVPEAIPGVEATVARARAAGAAAVLITRVLAPTQRPRVTPTQAATPVPETTTAAIIPARAVGRVPAAGRGAITMAALVLGDVMGEGFTPPT